MTIIEQVSQFGTLFNGIGLMFVFWKLGGNKASAEVISTYKEQVSQYKDQVNKLRDEVSVLTKDLFTTKGIITEKENQLKNLQSIIQGRDPSTQSFVNFMTTVANEAQVYMKSSSDQLKKNEISINEVKYLLKVKHKKNGRYKMVK